MRVRPSSSTIAVVGILQRALGVLLDQQQRDAARAQLLQQGEQLLRPGSARARSRARRSASASARSISPRAISSIFCSPPESVEACVARLAAQHREAVHRPPPMRGFEIEALRRRDAAELEVVQHRAARERCCAPAARSRCRQRSARAASRLVISRPSKKMRPSAPAACRTPP